MGFKLAVLALALSGVEAFVPSSASRAPTQLSETKADLVELQKSIAGPPGFWDPLSLADMSFDIGWDSPNGGLGEEGTIGWLRHAEIKHGRVAMAAFLGFIAGSTPLVSGEHILKPYSGYVAGCTPQEQWDNIPIEGKLQIFTLIGMLESYGEGAGRDDFVHYTKGGQPGYFPPIKGMSSNQIKFDLYDPFNFGFRAKSAESRARGLKSEILNGRAAMMGIFGFISESKVPGSVPFLSGIKGFPHYDGDVMAPFSHDFSML